MNTQETLAIMSVLKAAFPAYYRGIKEEEAWNVVSLWQEMFAGDDPAIVAAAVKSLIATQKEGYPPTIGSVKEKVQQIMNPETETELEAWDLVRKAIQRSGYNAQEEFDALPPVIQRIVRTPEQLKAWAMMPEDTVQSVVSSNFQRSYRAKAAEAKWFESLPSDVKQLASSFAEKSLQKLPQTKKPEVKQLPTPERTKADIEADIQKMKEIVAGRKIPTEKTPVPSLENISDEEWESSRAKAIQMLKGGG